MENTDLYFADTAIQQSVRVVENVRLASGTFRLRMHCERIARQITPGQFLMLRLPGRDDPLVGRPFALYDTARHSSNTNDAVDVVYLVAGKMTSQLQHLAPRDRIDVWGPLGNGFRPVPEPVDHLVMVAGGIGQTPFLALAREVLHRQAYGDPPRAVPRVGRVTLCYGARSADLLAGLSDFEAAGVEVEISTDDGSAGHCGLITDVLQSLLSSSSSECLRVVCCGPEAMLRAVAEMTERYAVPAEISLETPMACGIGICFSCVAQVFDDQGRADFRRTCVEGPVFDARRIKWD